MKFEPTWFYNRWREICAIVFLVLVIFDFIIAPIIYEAFYKPEPLSNIVAQALKLSPSAQAIFITAAMATRPHTEWQPVTLDSNGILYFCFLTILGIASWKTPQNPLTPPTFTPNEDNSKSTKSLSGTTE